MRPAFPGELGGIPDSSNALTGDLGAALLGPYLWVLLLLLLLLCCCCLCLYFLFCWRRRKALANDEMIDLADILSLTTSSKPYAPSDRTESGESLTLHRRVIPTLSFPTSIKISFGMFGVRRQVLQTVEVGIGDQPVAQPEPEGSTEQQLDLPSGFASGMGKSLHEVSAQI